MTSNTHKNLSDAILSKSKTYFDPAHRKVKILEDKEALKIAADHDCSIHDIYVNALSLGIWPYRYVRNQNGVSIEEQLKLAQSQISVVGSGGLGGTVILLLARIGIGTLVIIDYDHFDETNLNRQAISSMSSIGKSKSEEAAKMVKAINPGVIVKPYQNKIDSSNASELLKGSKLVVDALDNIQDRLLLEKIARSLGIPYVHGAIAGFDGQVMTIFPEDPGLKQLYGEKAPEPNDPERPEAVMGVPALTPSLIATLQATEVIKIILNRGRILRNRMIHIDLETTRFNEFKF